MWNSTFYMMERILQQQQPLCATLIEIRRSDLMPTDAEISNMEGFVEAMRPFAEITKVMGKEKQVSFSAVRLFLYKLLSVHLIEKPSDSSVMKQIKQVVKSDLEDRYSDPHLMMLLNKACFLDPRFKSLPFLSDEDRKSVLLSVEEEAAQIKTEMVSSKGENPADEPEPSKKKAKQESKFLSLLEDVLDKLDTTHADINPQEVANKEIQKYLCIDANRKENPTRWWKIYCTQLPLLATMARKYLCIPATSVPSERAFSTAGNIVNAKRSCLLPENTKILTFLAQNLD